MAARCCLIVGARYRLCIFFDVGGHRDRRQLGEREPARVASGEESRHGRGVRRTRVRIADLGGEKFHGPLGGLRPAAPDDGREAIDLPAAAHDECRFRRCGHGRQGAPAAAGLARVGESAGLSAQS